MDIYDFSDYKKFTLSALSERPKKGRGQLAKMAAAVGTHSSLISQVFNGDRNITEEQAFSVAEFLELNARETYYYVLLVQRERSGHEKLKKLLDAQIKQVQKDSSQLKNRVTVEKELSFEQQALFYSSWIHAAIYALTSVEGLDNIKILSEKLNLSEETTKKAVDALLELGLCTQKNGRIGVGPRSIFLGSESPLIAHHHSNWRIKSLQKMADPKEDHFFYTIPFSISKDDYLEVRHDLRKFAESIGKRIRSTDAVEIAACLNIDLFKI